MASAPSSSGSKAATPSKTRSSCSAPAAASKEREKKLAPQIAELKAKDPNEGAVYDAGIAKLYAENPLPPVSYTRIVDHIDHIVKVAGIDHVGLGSDFDGIPSAPEGME